MRARALRPPGSPRACARGGADRAGRLVLTTACAGATAFASTPQFSCPSAAAAPVPRWRGRRAGAAAFGTETETSTGAVDTETATFPTWTFTETPGKLTLT